MEEAVTAPFRAPVVGAARVAQVAAAAEAGRGSVLTAGVAGLVAGAMSMAAGEYVSVSSQADTERADLERAEPGQIYRAAERPTLDMTSSTSG